MHVTLNARCRGALLPWENHGENHGKTMKVIWLWECHRILVGGLEHLDYFSIQLGIILPTDFHIFQRGGSTTNQDMVMKTGIKSSFEVNELDGTMDVLLPPTHLLTTIYHFTRSINLMDNR